MIAASARRSGWREALMSIIATGQVVNPPTVVEINLLRRRVAVLYHWNWDCDAIDTVIGEAIATASVTAVADQAMPFVDEALNGRFHQNQPFDHGDPAKQQSALFSDVQLLHQLCQIRSLVRLGSVNAIELSACGGNVVRVVGDADAALLKSWQGLGAVKGKRLGCHRAGV